MALLTTFTNTKAKLANAGPGGVCYPDWKDFTVDEIRQHIGLYVWNGLSPSPCLEMKLQSAIADPVHGNDFIHQHMGLNAVRRHKHFRAFFACQDARIDPPDRKKSPLFKVQPLIKWMNHIGPAVVNLSQHASVDERTIGFQGRHANKLKEMGSKPIAFVRMASLMLFTSGTSHHQPSTHQKACHHYIHGSCGCSITSKTGTTTSGWTTSICPLSLLKQLSCTSTKY
jgi:Transposase IS4